MSLFGWLTGSDDQNAAIRQASNTQAEGSKYAADIQKKMFDRQVELMSPYLQGGYDANLSLRALAAGRPITTDAPNVATNIGSASLASTDDGSGDLPSLADFIAGRAGQLNGQPSPTPLGPTRGGTPNPQVPRGPKGGVASGKPVKGASMADLTAYGVPRVTTPVPQGAVLPTQADIPQLSNLPAIFSGPDLPNVPGLPDYDEMVTDASYEDDPAVKYRMAAGTRDLNRLLASRGLLGGGQAVTALSDLGQRIRGEEFGNMFSRNQSRYSAALQDALTKYGLSTERANSLYGAGKDIYNAGTDQAFNQYNAGLKGFGIKSDLAGQNYGRLTDLVKIGQGAAGNIGGAAAGYGNNASNLYLNSSNNLANSQLALGQVAANNSPLNIGLKVGTVAAGFMK